MSIGGKIELGGHWFIVKRRIATYLFMGREVASRITKRYGFEKQISFLEHK